MKFQVTKARKKRRPLGRLDLSSGVWLLADMPQTVLAPKRRSWLADNTAVVTAIITLAVVPVIIRIDVVAERSGSNGAGGSDRAANHAGGYIGRPEAHVTVMDARAVLLLTNDLRPRHGILRHRRNCDRGRE